MDLAQTETLADLIISRRSLIIQEAGLTQRNLEQQFDLLTRHLVLQNSLEAKLAISQMEQQNTTQSADGIQAQHEPLTVAQLNQLLATHEKCIKKWKTEYGTEAQELQTSQNEQRADMRQQINHLSASIAQHRRAFSLAPVPEYSTPPLDFDAFNTHIPIVIGKGGKWHEIACCFCGANSRSSGFGDYHAGWPGLKRHMKNWHDFEAFEVPQDALFRWRTRRTFDEYDVDLMHHGIQPRSLELVPTVGDGTGMVQVDELSLVNFVWRRVYG